MTQRKLCKSDLIMVVSGLSVGLFHTYLYPLFTFWHFMLISSAYGGYITLRLFTAFQEHLADRKGLLREYNEINKLEKDEK